MVNTQGKSFESLIVQKRLAKSKRNGTEIRLVGDNSYEMVATDEQLEKLARAEAEIEAEIKAWEDALNESLDEREERRRDRRN